MPFLYFFQVVCTLTSSVSSVSEYERQSEEAVSRSESAMFPFGGPECEGVQSLVFFELLVTALSSGSAGPLMGLEEGLENSLSLSPGASSGFWC